MKRIDLRSDTVTAPGAAMREAMARAEVGDDVYGEDPSVNRLQEQVAARLGKEAALFVPSGTMANQLALRVHTRPGDSAIVGRDVHLYLYESGAGAALSGVQFVHLGDDGFFDGADVRAAVHPPDSHYSPVRLVCAENTHNRSGGRVFPFERVRGVRDAARACGLALHLDGARLFNAEQASGIPAAEWAACYDSVSVCMSKGLGAPIGSLLAGSRVFVAEAHRYRKMFGGGMRQAGVLAAAALYALDHHVKRLGDDHANARRLADGLRELPGVALEAEPETNMVLFRVPELGRFVQETRARELWINPIDVATLRAVTHLDVSAADIEEALRRLREVLS